MEIDYIYETSNEISDLNQKNILKPYGYQKLIAQVIDWHIGKIKYGFDMTLKYKLAWVLVSLSIEILKPVEGVTKMYAQTWHSQRKGPFFRRDFVFKDECGEILFHGAGYSILLDMENRTVYRKKELPFTGLEQYKCFTIDANPTNKVCAESTYVTADRRKVYNSFIDCLGHINNIRYGEFAYDAFSGGECMRLAKLKRMDIYFRSELKPDDEFSVLKACEKNRIIIRGHNTTKSDISFDMVFEFAE